MNQLVVFMKIYRDLRENKQRWVGDDIATGNYRGTTSIDHI